MNPLDTYIRESSLVISVFTAPVLHTQNTKDFGADKEKFAKRKVKSRRGLRSQKSPKEDE